MLPILIMITYILGTSYLLGAAGIGHCLLSVRRLDDELTEYTQLREQDFTFDKTDTSSLPRKSLLLIKLSKTEEQ